MNVSTLVALAGAIGGLVAAAIALYLARQQRKKLVVDTDQTVVTTAVDMAERLTATASSLVGPLQQQLTLAQQETAAMRERIAALEVKADRASREYQDCRERELRAMANERRLAEELSSVRSYLKVRRDDDLLPTKDPVPAPPRREVWTEEQRAAYRAQQAAGGVKREPPPA